jgi:hypothetical protein
MVMNKKEALQNCLDCIEEYGYISEDGVLDECDENMKLVKFCRKKLDKMVENGSLTPKRAIQDSLKMLLQLFYPILDLNFLKKLSSKPLFKSLKAKHLKKFFIGAKLL